MLDPINDKLKKSIEQQNISWDKEAMWLDIEPQLPKKSNKKWLLLLLLLLLIGISAAGILIYNNAKATINRGMAATELEQESSTSGTIAQADIVSTPTVDQSNNAINAKYQNETAPANTNVANNKINRNTETVVNKTIKKSTAYANNNTENNTNNTYESTSVNANSSDQVITYKPMASTIITSDKEPTKSISVGNEVLRTINDIKPLDKSINLLTGNKFTLDLAADVRIPIKTKKSLPGAMSLTAGAFVFNKKYNATSELSADLNAAYTPLESFNLSLAYHKRLSTKWSVISGLEVLYDVERFDYTASSSTSKNITVDTAFYFIENMEKVFVAGNRDEVTTDTKRVRSYNTRLSLGIPLYVSYDLFARRSSLSIVGGPVAHITALEQGYNVENTSSILAINTEAFDPSTIALSFDVSLAYTYKFNNRLKLAVSPSIRRQLNTNVDVSKVNYKRNFFGLKAGILWAI